MSYLNSLIEQGLQTKKGMLAASLTLDGDDATPFLPPRLGLLLWLLWLLWLLRLSRPALLVRLLMLPRPVLLPVLLLVVQSQFRDRIMDTLNPHHAHKKETPNARFSMILNFQNLHTVCKGQVTVKYRIA